jgi:hypothetical protein
VALMSAFFDESESGEFLTLGGYLFRRSMVRPFESDWSRMLRRYDLPYFRMSACNVERPPFDKLSRDECDLVAREAIRLVIKYAKLGYFVAIKPTEFYEVVGERGFAYNPYTLCAHVCLLGMRYWADRNDPKARISYFFEAGAKHQRDAALVFDNLANDPSREWKEMYSGHTFVLKKKSMPTQAADMLARQASKQMKRAENGLQRPRGDFAALLDGVRHEWLEATKSRLQELVDNLNQAAGVDDGHRLVGRALRSPKLAQLNFDTLR